MGQRLWEQIRAELEARPGFDLKAFHTQALNIGSVGLDTLRAGAAFLGRLPAADWPVEHPADRLDHRPRWGDACHSRGGNNFTNG